MEENLDNLINDFFNAKTEADNCKKEAEQYNTKIKELMTEMKVDNYLTDNGLQAKITIQNRESFNEPALIEKLCEIDCSDAIDLVPTINYDKLEDMIYNGKLDASILNEFKEIKEVVTLKVSKKKGE